MISLTLLNKAMINTKSLISKAFGLIILVVVMMANIQKRSGANPIGNCCWSIMRQHEYYTLSEKNILSRWVSNSCFIFMFLCKSDTSIFCLISLSLEKLKKKSKIEVTFFKIRLCQTSPVNMLNTPHTNIHISIFIRSEIQLLIIYCSRNVSLKLLNSIIFKRLERSTKNVT